MVIFHCHVSLLDGISIVFKQCPSFFLGLRLKTHLKHFTKNSDISKSLFRNFESHLYLSSQFMKMQNWKILSPKKRPQNIDFAVFDNLGRPHNGWLNR